MPRLRSLAAWAAVAFVGWIAVAPSSSCAQPEAPPDSVQADSVTHPTGLRGPLWITPSPVGTITGVSIGPMLTQNNMWGGAQRINGIAVDFIGLGLLMPLAPHHPIQHPLFGRAQPDERQARTRIGGTTVNGILAAAAGPFLRRVNGVGGSFLAGVAGDVRGVFVGGIWTMVSRRFVGVTGGGITHALHGDGVMIGAWTRVVDLQGVQVGAINNSA